MLTTARASLAAVLPLLATPPPYHRHLPVQLVAPEPLRSSTSIRLDPSLTGRGTAPPQFWEQPPEHELPEELMGPWELQCDMSGYGAMWVELHETGKCSCTSRIGKGRKWSAVPTQPAGNWRLRFVLLDKLSRQLRWEGEVRPDDTRGVVVSGSIYGPPKRGSKAEAVVVGTFEGYRLG